MSVNLSFAEYCKRSTHNKDTFDDQTPMFLSRIKLSTGEKMLLFHEDNKLPYPHEMDGVPYELEDPTETSLDFVKVNREMKEAQGTPIYLEKKAVVEQVLTMLMGYVGSIYVIPPQKSE